MTSCWKRPSGGAWGGGSEASLWSWALCLSCHCKSPLPASCRSAALSPGSPGAGCPPAPGTAHRPPHPTSLSVLPSCRGRRHFHARDGVIKSDI